MRRTQRWMILGYALTGLALAMPCARAQGVEVTATVTVQPKNSTNTARRKSDRSSADVVVWLTPLQPDPEHPAAADHPGPFRLVQKEKTVLASSAGHSCRQQRRVSERRSLLPQCLLTLQRQAF